MHSYLTLPCCSTNQMFEVLEGRKLTMVAASTPCWLAVLGCASASRLRSWPCSSALLQCKQSSECWYHAARHVDKGNLCAPPTTQPLPESTSKVSLLQ